MPTSHHDLIERTVTLPADGVTLQADLSIPRNAHGIVLFAHGSGSSRKSPRNRAVAAELQRAHFATLLLDLLTLDEEHIDEVTRHLRFDIPLLATRLVAATHWVQRSAQVKALRVGYFGASTGAGAALVAAAQLGDAVHAVVSRGGRPDLAGPVLADVRAPTLLIVGGYDRQVIAMNRAALGRLHTVKHMEIIPHATHLFEEPGAMEQVTHLARDWFETHLARHNGHAPRANAG